MQSLGKLIQRSLLHKTVNPALAQTAVRFRHHNHDHEGECHHNAWDYPVLARVQHPAPHFEGMSWHMNEFKKISLTDYKGKYVVLFTYPLDFTFVCPTEIIEFSDKAAEFEKIGCQVIAASIDSHFTHQEFANKPRDKGGLGGMKVPMLADLTKSLGRDYGLLTADDALHLRATFIIDGKGVLRHSQFNDLPVGRNVDEILRLVQAYQYTDKHGEVCPSGWKPGSKTMDPNHKSEKTLKYWKEQHAK